MPRKAIITLNILCSLILGFIFVILTGELFDAYDLPIFHMNAIMHGLILYMFPLYALGFFYIFDALISKPVIRKGREIRSEAKVSFSRPAIISLLFSAIGIIAPFLGLVGIFAGHKARRDIRKNDKMRGDALASLGLGLGYLTLFFYVILAIIILYAVYFSS